MSNDNTLGNVFRKKHGRYHGGNMDFQLSKSQKEIQKAAREFAKGEFDKDLANEQEKLGVFPEKIRAKAAELGFIGIHYPEAYYGGNLGVFENTLLAEEFCKKDSSLGIALMLSGFAAECVLRFGSDGLKDRFLPEIVDGKMLSGAAFTEPGSGYDITGINTTAVKYGDEWIVNGQKSFVLNGDKAGFYCVLCRTSSVDDPLKGTSMILVEGDREGIATVNNRNKLGMRMTAVSDLNLEKVRVPAANLIGKEGHGMQQVLAFYNECRILTAAMALGIARGAFARALDYVKQREQFGRKIAQFQVTRHKLADMATAIEQAGFMTYGAAKNHDLDKSDSGLMAMARISACRAALFVSSEAIQLLGGYGYMTEYEVERFYRDAKALEIISENSGLLKDTIAEKIVGKIR